ncbi:hypothetical protein MLM_1233 [Mycobacterium lepraemurium]|nr:hypothetical protein MLM_1233 [Mycobacterium lepraemurium]
MGCGSQEVLLLVDSVTPRAGRAPSCDRRGGPTRPHQPGSARSPAFQARGLGAIRAQHRPPAAARARDRLAKHQVSPAGMRAAGNLPVRYRSRDGTVGTSTRLAIGTHIQGRFVWRRYYKSYCSIQFTATTCNTAVRQLPEVCGLG